MSYKQLRFKQGEITSQQMVEAKRMRKVLNDAGYDADPVTIILALKHYKNAYHAAFWRSTAWKHDEKEVEALLSILEVAPEAPDAPAVNALYKNSREAVLAFIVQFKQENNGIAPSVRDIQSALGISSTNVVTHHLNRLSQEGLISFPLGSTLARAIALPGYEFRKC